MSVELTVTRLIKLGKKYIIGFLFVGPHKNKQTKNLTSPLE